VKPRRSTGSWRSLLHATATATQSKIHSTNFNSCSDFLQHSFFALKFCWFLLKIRSRSVSYSFVCFSKE
jgi:hypothetical protein